MIASIGLFWIRYMDALAGWSLDSLRWVAGRQALIGRRALDALVHPGLDAVSRLQGLVGHSQQDLLAAPFDAARLQHAAAVQSGAAPRSLLESAQFEHLLGCLEAQALGPLARSR